MVPEGESAAQQLLEKIDAVARVALDNAGDVDVNGRFPKETIEAARKFDLLSIFAPRWASGEQWSLRDTARLCARIAEACGSTGLVLAMHHLQMACLRYYGGETAELRNFACRAVEENWLLGSITTERATGGDIRSSACALSCAEDGTLALVKDATVVSYGAHADALLVSARASAESPVSDQVLICLSPGQFTLAKQREWQTLGMRGTESSGFQLDAKPTRGLVMATPFAEINARTLLPVAHVLWGAVWVGIAVDSLERARRALRRRAAPELIAEFGRARMSLDAARFAVSSMARDFDALEGDASRHQEKISEKPESFNSLKAVVSENCLQATLGALRVAGMDGYRRDGEFSIERNLRDICSSIIMINNSKIIEAVGNFSLVDGIGKGEFYL